MNYGMGQVDISVCLALNVGRTIITLVGFFFCFAIKGPHKRQGLSEFKDFHRSHFVTMKTYYHINPYLDHQNQDETPHPQ